MTYLDDVSWSEAYRRGITGNDESPAELCSILRSNWDVWESAQPREPMGLARLPHLAIVRKVDPTGHGLRPVLAPDMDKHLLEAGFWRQLRIYPDVGVDVTQAVDPFSPDQQMPVDGGRARFLRQIFGHDVTDCVLYLDDVRQRDRKLYRLLLAKDYLAAFKHRPDILDDPWPYAAQTRWKLTKGRDYLPPVLALALMTEAARLGHNQHGVLGLSFDERGKEIFIRPYLEAIPSVGGPIEPPHWLARHVENSIFQTTALMPPDHVFPHIANGIIIPGNPELGRAWSEGAATVIAAVLGAGGAAHVRMVTRPGTADDAKKLKDGIAFHPRHQAQTHVGKAPSISKGQPSAYWAMNWRIHPIVGLLDLARQAFDWSKRHRTGRNQLRNWSEDKPKRWLTKAVTAISYCWVESFSAAALQTALKPLIDSKRNWRVRNSHERAIDGLFELTDEEREIDSLADGANFGSTICAEALTWLASLPGPGNEGYTARYRAHLWFDQHGDDIVHYQRHQRNALRGFRHLRRTGCAIDPELLDGFEPAHRKLLTMPDGRLRLPGNQSDSPGMKAIRQAARSAQDLAMMPSPFALDPMRLFIAQPHRWTGTPNAADPPTAS